MLEMATVIVMAGVIFDSRPARTLKADVVVMLERTRDELPAIQQLWPRFEDLVGLRGRDVSGCDRGRQARHDAGSRLSSR
jgi:hypothetical protein